MLLIIFFKKLLNKWWALLAFLPTLYDNNSAYLSSNLPNQYQDFKIGPIFSNAIVGLTLLFAFYQVWEEEYKLRLSLEAKIAESENRKPKYEPSVSIIEKYKFEHMLNDLEKENKWLSAKKLYCETQLKPKEVPEGPLKDFFIGFNSGYIGNSANISIFLSDLELYEKQLIRFKHELFDVLDKYRFFKVNIDLKNVGNIFDESVCISILSKDSHFYEPYELKENVLPLIPDRPIDLTTLPVIHNGIMSIESGFTNYFESSGEIVYGNALLDPEYRQVKSISKNRIEVELEKIASHQMLGLVTKQTLIIMISKNNFTTEISFEIKSKNTQQPLIYKVSLNLPAQEAK